MAQLFTNNATTRLTATLSAVGTSFTVDAGDGALFPSPELADQDYFLVTLEDSLGNREIVKIIARSGDTFTIGSVITADPSGRAQEGTSALAFAVTDLVELRLTSGFIDALKKGSIVYVIDGGGAAITTGIKGFLEVPFSGSLDEIRLFADQAGSISIDILKDTYANYPPEETWDTKGIVVITGAQKAEDDLSLWAVADRQFTAGDIFAFDVNSCSSITRLTISMSVSRNA